MGETRQVRSIGLSRNIKFVRATALHPGTNPPQSLEPRSQTSHISCLGFESEYQWH
uniref:Uncharacterized protein n=1 Tax=Anguilla anguilla TaxID=7936 RepID=A0A0E9QPJ7_ANGAN